MLRPPVLRITLLVALAAAALAACAPTKNTPLAEIPKLTSLDDVMDNQATAADPQFKKIGQPQYSDADYAAFAEVATRVAATSLKTKSFSKGPEFDAITMKVNAQAKALGAAAASKNATGASAALAEMKAACKECHSRFR